MSDYHDMVCWQNYKDAVNRIEKVKETAKQLSPRVLESIHPSVRKVRQDAMDTYRYYQGNLDELLSGLNEEEHNDFWNQMDALWELIYNL